MSLHHGGPEGGALPPPPPPLPLPPPGWVLDSVLPPPVRAREAASFWRRFGALLIDGVVTSVPRLALGTGERGQLLGLVLIAAYYVVAEGQYGATIGKRALGLRVVGADGHPIGLWMAFIRYLGHVVSALALFLGYFWMIWDKDHQTWHDKLAHSYVERT